MYEEKERSYICGSAFFIDQLIKIYIYLNLMDVNTVFIEGFLEFSPIFNRNYSWLDSVFQWGFSRGYHIITALIFLAGLILIYDFLITKKTRHMDKVICLAFIFGIAGSSCSLIDRLVWNGSLDYIYLVDYFTFDLKDVYLTIFEVLIILSAILKFKEYKDVDEKRIIREFWAFVKHKYLRVGRKA